jgi:hypothetical protein
MLNAAVLLYVDIWVNFCLSGITYGIPKDMIYFNLFLSDHGHIQPWSDKNLLEEKQI